jgi:hypothetical protein
MITIMQLEKEGNNSYAKAFNAIKASMKPLFFYTPKGKVIITGRDSNKGYTPAVCTDYPLEELSAADGILFIVTPSQKYEELEAISKQFKDTAEFSKAGKAAIIVNKM